MKTHANWLFKFVHCHQHLFHQEPFETTMIRTEKTIEKANCQIVSTNCFFLTMMSHFTNYVFHVFWNRSEPEHLGKMIAGTNDEFNGVLSSNLTVVSNVCLISIL